MSISEEATPHTTDPNFTSGSRIQFDPALSLGLHMIAKNEKGSQFLERILAQRTETSTICQIIPYIFDLATHSLGNLVVVKLVDVCSEYQRMHIVQYLTTDPEQFIQISCDMHGTTLIQKLVETVERNEEIAILISALKPGVLQLIKNENGKHVVLRCLQYLLPHCEEFIFDVVFQRCIELAIEPNGAFVVQNFFNYSNDTQNALLLTKLTSDALFLSQDPFGNYVLEKILESEFHWAVLAIIEKFVGRYMEISMEEYSWRLVVKCIELSDNQYLSCIIGELVNHIDKLMFDPFGNGVILAALTHSKGCLRDFLIDAIQPHRPSLQDNTYGEKVLYALNSLQQ